MCVNEKKVRYHLMANVCRQKCYSFPTGFQFSESREAATYLALESVFLDGADHCGNIYSQGNMTYRSFFNSKNMNSVIQERQRKTEREKKLFLLYNPSPLNSHSAETMEREDEESIGGN